MAPARTWDITVDGNSFPLVAGHVVYIEVVQSDVLDDGEDRIVSSAKYYKLVFEKSGRMLRAGYGTSSFRLELFGMQSHFWFFQRFIVAAGFGYDLVISFEVRTYPNKVIGLEAVLVNATKHIHTLFGDLGLPFKFAHRLDEDKTRKLSTVWNR